MRPLDADGDGLPNAWELANGLNIALDDAFFDPDRDGAVNLRRPRAAVRDLEMLHWIPPASPGSRMFA